MYQEWVIYFRLHEAIWCSTGPVIHFHNPGRRAQGWDKYLEGSLLCLLVLSGWTEVAFSTNYTQPASTPTHCGPVFSDHTYAAPLSPLLSCFFSSCPDVVSQGMAMSSLLRYILSSLLSALILPASSLQQLPLGFPLAVVMNTFTIIWLNHIPPTPWLDPKTLHLSKCHSCKCNVFLLHSWKHFIFLHWLLTMYRFNHLCWLWEM